MDIFIGGQQCASLFSGGHEVMKAWKNGVQFFKSPNFPPIILTNMISNGSFESNTSGWTASGGTFSRISLPTPHGESGSYCGQINYTVNGNVTVTQSANQSGVVSGHKYYIRARAKTGRSGYSNVVQIFNSSTSIGQSVSGLSTSSWGFTDVLWTANTATFRLRLQFSGGSNRSQRLPQFDNIVMLDLTESFGDGKEPSIEEIRAIVDDAGGFFSSTEIEG